MKYRALIIVLIICFGPIGAQTTSLKQSQDTTKIKKEYPYALPIWGQKATDRDIELQLPFGVNVNYVYNQMTLELTEFSMNFFDGENLDDIINPESLNFTETIGNLNGINFRADAWIFPFLNVYGLYSRNQGSTKVSLQPQVVEKDLGPNENIIEIRTLETPINVPPVEFTTNSFGLGASAVYGLSNYFVNLDGNVSWTNSDLLEQTVTFFVGSLRFGRRVKFRNGMKLAFYIGVMYRDFLNKENNTGSLSIPEMDQAMLETIDAFTEINNDLIDFWEGLPEVTPGREDKLNELYARDTRLMEAKDRIENSPTVNYDIRKEIVNNWSTQLGFNFEITPNWMYRAELGYREGQKFFMTGLQFRFGL